MLKLIEPILEYTDQIESFKQEVLNLEVSEDKFAGCLGLDNCNTVSEWIELCKMRSNPIRCRELTHSVLSDTYLAIRESDGKLVGIIDLRYGTSKELYSWGNCGYSIRPSEQHKGYGKEMLGLLKVEARGKGIKELLIICDSNNIASKKVIEANSGILNKQGQNNLGCIESRYMIYI